MEGEEKRRVATDIVVKWKGQKTVKWLRRLSYSGREGKPISGHGYYRKAEGAENC